MVRLIYCEMLGYDASFGYIHAIKLAQQGNLLEKRVGMYVFKTSVLLFLRFALGIVSFIVLGTKCRP